jgi:hypothetical protein
MNLQGQLESLKDNSTDAIHSFLQEKLRCAAWRTSVLLRQSVSDFLEKDNAFTAAEVRRWAQYLDGYPVDGGSYLFLAEAERCFQTAIDSNSQMTDAAMFLRRLVLVRPGSSPGINVQMTDAHAHLPEPMFKNSTVMHQPFWLK